jgi:hypothetical protein
MDIFSWAQDKVMGFLGDWLNRLTGITNLILNPIAAIVREIGGGGIWTGRGADKFIAELTGNTKNELTQVEQIGKQWHDGIQKASDVMFQAMQSTNQMVAGLFEEVNKI